MVAIPDPVHPSAVLDLLEDHCDVVVPVANGEPTAVLDAIEAGVDRLHDVRGPQMPVLHTRPSLHAAPGDDRLRHVSYFLSHVTRPAYWAGTVDLVPNHFSEVPHLLRTETKCSLVVAAVSPPDRHGYFSLGTTADYTAALIGRAPFFVEV